MCGKPFGDGLMRRYYYDLHIHSCLSPCGDDDNTPNNILGMASISGLDIVALTDHNTAKNCPAFFSAAENYNVIPIAGMELTTSEDIHVVCLFEKLSDAMRFDGFVSRSRMLIKNKPDFFGRQQILDADDNFVSEEEYLLLNATDISVEDVCSSVKEYGGVCYPAHIDKDENGIIAILGAIPPDAEFKFYEIHSCEKREALCERFNIPHDKVIISSDAHYLSDIRDRENYFSLSSEKCEPDKVRAELFKLLRGEISAK